MLLLLLFMLLLLSSSSIPEGVELVLDDIEEGLGVQVVLLLHPEATTTNIEVKQPIN